MGEGIVESYVTPPAQLPGYLLEALNFIATNNVHAISQIEWGIVRSFGPRASRDFSWEIKNNPEIRRALVKTLLKSVARRYGYRPTVENARILDRAIRLKRFRNFENPDCASARFGVRAALSRRSGGETGDAGQSEVSRKPATSRSTAPASPTFSPDTEQGETHVA